MKADEYHGTEELERKAIHDGLKEAIRLEVESLKKQGQSLVISRNGKVEVINPISDYGRDTTRSDDYDNS